MVQILLKYKANPSSLNHNYETPIHCAAQAGNLSTLKLLVERGGLFGLIQQINRKKSRQAQSFSGTRRRRHLSSRLSGKVPASKPPESPNLLLAACESQNSDCVEYLIEEIMRARRERFHDLEDRVEVFPFATNDDQIDEGHLGDHRNQFFYWLGTELAASNSAMTSTQLEQSIYGKMLAKTPKAFHFLLDSCIYTKGRKTYVDLFPFYNPEGSELNILTVIIHFKKYEFLTHPLCVNSSGRLSQNCRLNIALLSCTSFAICTMAIKTADTMTGILSQLPMQ